MRILFVCTGNAGRSQMAAAFASRLAPAGVHVTDAGDAPGELAGATRRVMREAG